MTYNSERRISGTPTAAKAKNTCTYTATDEESEEKTDLEFDVEAVVAPSFATDATIDDQFWLSGTEIDTLTLPEATGGTGTLTYSLTPAAPAGLEFDATDRTITGTPTAAATTEFTYTVTDGNGTKTPLTFEITVGTALLFGSNTIAAQTWTQDEAITDLTLPEATGGVGTLTYSLSPTLPAGVTFAAGTRLLSGTPTAALAETAFTYTVTDQAKKTLALTFNITVSAPSTQALAGNRAQQAALAAIGGGVLDGLIGAVSERADGGGRGAEISPE